MILVNRERVPPVNIDDSFVYLGKLFNFGNNIDSIKLHLKDLALSYITTIDRLPLTTQNKLSIVQQYVFSKFRWQFSIYELSETWIHQNIDNIISKYVRKWCQLPACANVEHLSLTLQKLGLDFKFAASLYQQCKLTIRRILSQSQNNEIRRLYSLTSPQNIRTDSLINQVSRCHPDLEKKQLSARIVRDSNKITREEVWNKFMNLKEQNIIIKHIISACQVMTINMWQALAKKLPSNIFNFSRRALTFCLPNNSNLYRWKCIDNDQCVWCKKSQTQKHVLSNCGKCLDRYTWRHDSVLNSLVHKLTRSNKVMEIYVDVSQLNMYKCPSEIFDNQRPDLVLKLNQRIIVIELTICFETNTEKSRSYKQGRYKQLRDNLTIQCESFEVIFLEFTTLGFISSLANAPFRKLLQELEINYDRTVYKCMETAIRASYFIFCRRNKIWNEPQLLNFY